MVIFMQRYEALRIHRAYIDEWLGVVDDGRRRKRRSRVVYGEEVEGAEGTIRQESQLGGLGSGGVADIVGNGGDDDEDEGSEESREEQEQEAEGTKVQLERGASAKSDADHVVYLNPTLFLAAQPTAGQVRGDRIVATHGAIDFLSALHSFLRSHKTRRYVHKNFLPTLHHHFLVWHRLYLHHRPLPFDPENAKRDVIRARPRGGHHEDIFDVALLDNGGYEFGLKRKFCSRYLFIQCPTRANNPRPRLLRRARSCYLLAS